MIPLPRPLASRRGRLHRAAAAVLASLAGLAVAMPCAVVAAPAEIRQLAAGDTATALPKLVAALADTAPHVQETAALAIAALADQAAADDGDGPDFTPAAKALTGLLAGADGAVVRAAATALGVIGPVDDDDATDAVVEALERALARDRDAETRAACLVAIGDFGPAARGAVPGVARALRAPSALVRETAAAALASIGPESRVATGELARLLGDGQALVRSAATAALTAIGPDARDATPALAAALADGDAMVRGGAARALAAIGPDAAGAVGALTKALGAEQDRDVSLGIIDAFGEIGPGAIQAAPALVALVVSDAPDAETREAAVSALGEFGPQAATTAGAAVEKLLDDADPFVRVAAVGALEGLGRKSPRGRAILLKSLASDDEDLQAAAAEVIGDAGRAAPGYGAALGRVATAAKAPHTRAAAVAALGDIAAGDQAEVLGKALDDDDADVRHAAAYAIADLPEIVAGLEPALVAAADDDDVRVRMEIAPVLARLASPAAKKALATLADDDDENVAAVARQALGPAAAAR